MPISRPKFHVRHPIVAPFLAAVSLALLEYPGVPAANQLSICLVLSADIILASD
jgi:hypothetical protein